MFEESFTVVSKMLQGSFAGVSTKIEGCSKIPLMVIQGSFKSIYLKEVQRVFQVSFKAVSKTIEGSF